LAIIIAFLVAVVVGAFKVRRRWKEKRARAPAAAEEAEPGGTELGPVPASV
jgi:uncharacterized protein YneF (UPF0154 family)